MRKISDFELSIDRAILQVYDTALSDSDYNYHDVTDQTLSQGFCGLSGSYDFYSLGDCQRMKIEVWEALPQESIQLRSQTVRAIRVPFAVHGSGMTFSNIMGDDFPSVEISNGEYALVFEIRLRDDDEYLNSPRYLEDIQGNFTREICCLTLYPVVEPVQAEILRLDSWSTPRYFEERYHPLNPTYPLLLEQAIENME
ncbi:MAG: hypothetical protein HC773_28115 [Scytonema sp. CRU_2_7]|nr:hypothetical protein [Scytonema sp. CRU_2_7]